MNLVANYEFFSFTVWQRRIFVFFVIVFQFFVIFEDFEKFEIQKSEFQNSIATLFTSRLILLQILVILCVMEKFCVFI